MYIQFRIYDLKLPVRDSFLWNYSQAKTTNRYGWYVYADSGNDLVAWGNKSVPYMMTSSNEKFPALLALSSGNSPITGEFPSQRPVVRNFDVFFICTWRNGCLNNRDAGDLRSHCAHNDVTVMIHMASLRANGCDDGNPTIAKKLMDYEPYKSNPSPIRNCKT